MERMRAYNDCMSKCLLRSGFAVLCLFAFHASVAESVTTWSDTTITVDLGTFPVREALRPVAIRCNPRWCTDADGATSTLRIVRNPDAENAVTSSVPVEVGLGECDVSYVSESPECVRFVLGAEKDGVAIGNVLERDVSFGMMSGHAAMVYDNRTNALQETATANGNAILGYDLDWADSAASMEISSVRIRRAKDGSFMDETTNTIFESASFRLGDCPYSMYHMAWGEYRLLLRGYAVDGTLLLEYLSPEFIVPHVYGTCIVIR